MIEPGEYFHRETLTPVTVESVKHDFDERLCVLLRVPCGPGWIVPPDDFLRDYARNEQVTLELLERMGWERCENGMAIRIPNGRSSLVMEDGDLTVVPADDFFGTSIPTPATLRDLLVTLRVFNIDAKAE